MVLRTRGGQSLEQVADIRADAEIADAPDVEGDFHVGRRDAAGSRMSKTSGTG